MAAMTASSSSRSAGDPMRRLTSVLIAATLVAGALVTVAGSPASACGRAVERRDVFRAMRNDQSLKAGVISVSGGMEQVSVLTFNLELGKLKPEYKIGDVVPIDVTVTRPAKEDPLGNGVPMERPVVEPAAGVIVGVGLHLGRVFLPGAGITDENGLARIRIKIQDYVPVGAKVDASIYAWKVIQETPCASVQEYGYMAARGLFKTSR